VCRAWHGASRGSPPRLPNPVNLKRVITMIDDEDWTGMDVDVKGQAFEGLLEKAASKGKNRPKGRLSQCHSPLTPSRLRGFSSSAVPSTLSLSQPIEY